MQYSSSTLVLAAALGASVTLAHGGIESVAVSTFQSQFASAQIVPDVLAAFDPSVSFYAGYASTDGDNGLVMPGMNLTMSEAGAPIEFSVENLSNANASSSTKYIIAMVGPDAPSRGNPTSRSTRHYLAGNFSLAGSDSSILPTAAKLANTSAAFTEYAAPQPANGTGAHRYVYLLYAQPSSLDNASFESVGLNAGDRSNFDVSKFREQAGLGPAVGGTFFVVQTEGGNGTAGQTKENANAAGKVRAAGAMAVVPLVGAVALVLGL